MKKTSGIAVGYGTYEDAGINDYEYNDSDDEATTKKRDLGDRPKKTTTTTTSTTTTTTTKQKNNGPNRAERRAGIQKG